MKKLASLTLSLFLLGGTAFAGTPNDAEPQAAKTSNTVAKKKARKQQEPKSDPAVLAQLAALQQAMQAQQQQLQILKEELAKRDHQIDEARQAADAANARATEATTKATEAATTAAEVKTTAAATTDLDTQQNNRIVRIEKDTDATRKDTAEKFKALSALKFTGDLRLRDEPFFGGPTNQSQVRNRERFRARLNITTKVNDDINGGISLASGDVNDPISTNQTMNQFYTRKPFTLDRYFINYNPHYFKPLLLTGGKFAYPFYRTELVWDNDLNPEGLAQTLQWDFKSAPVIKHFALVGFELPFTEVAGVQATNKSIVQSAVYGGQVQAVWQLAGWLKLSTYGAYYNYHNPNPIAFALARASASNPQSPLLGLLPLIGASVQNSITTTTVTNIVTDTDTDPITGLPVTTTTPTGVKTITGAQFASQFGLFDAIAKFDITTPYKRLPVAILGDYVQNTRACANVGNLPLVGTTTTANAITAVTSNAPCNSRERRGYWLEGRVGRLSEKGDAQFSYTRMMIEREAVMGAFNFSDLRQNSNVSQHRVEFIYQAHKNIQLEFTGLFGRPLNWGKSTPPEPLLKRLQFDVIYKF
ncbi:MAG: hypothetical protein PVS2B2_06980 [Candidatus Acidiferrum sp.]